MRDDVYWIWLQSCLGIRSALHTDEILGRFETARNVYEAGEYDKRISGAFTPGQLEKLRSTDLTRAVKTAEQCDREGYRIVTPEDGDYPSMLFKLSDLPVVLYVNGDLDCLKNKISVALVGTRKPGVNSQNAAFALSASVTRSGAVVVSGGAVGIDACAHMGALSTGGKTVAVLGCGLNCSYPAANIALRREISENGALVTEYPPDTQAFGSNFPVRNRIISGLSYGTVVVEANEKSGSLITAGFAAEQGRDIFAVPGDILSSGFTGANKLIHDGAKPVFNAMDVLEDYAVRFPGMLDVEKIETELSPKDRPGYSPPVRKQEQRPADAAAEEEPEFVRPALTVHTGTDAARVYNAFDRQVMQAEELIMKTGLGSSDFSCAVTELELLDLIEPLPGKNYRLTVKK